MILYKYLSIHNEGIYSFSNNQEKKPLSITAHFLDLQNYLYRRILEQCQDRIEWFILPVIFKQHFILFSFPKMNSRQERNVFVFCQVNIE
ncbi:unknown [Tannerella sp. CAG:118]|nr:unknown [Tannerella sp. CAG:118]